MVELNKESNSKQAISNIVDDFVSKCSSKLSTDVRSIILFGSVARNDYVIGWSDIDMMLVFRDGRDRFSNLEKLKHICDEITTNYKNNTALRVYFFTKSICEKVLSRDYLTDIGMHLLIYSEKEVDNLSRQDFPTLFLYAIQKDMKCLFGSNVLESLKLPPKITPQMLLNGEMGLYDLKVRLRNTMLDYRLAKNPVIFGRDSIYCVLSAARNSLLLFGKDKFKTNKEEIVDSFTKYFSDFDYKRIVRESYEFRAKFIQLARDVEYVRNFYKESLMFIDKFIAFIERW